MFEVQCSRVQRSRLEPGTLNVELGSVNPYSAISWSERVNVIMRVMWMMSVSFAISGGNGAYGAARVTMRTAAASSMRCPEELLISTFSRVPSDLIDTVTMSLP